MTAILSIPRGRLRALVAFATIASSAQAAAQSVAAAAPEGAVAGHAAVASGCRGPAPGDEILVCGRRVPDELLPPQEQGFDPEGLIESVSRERHRLMEGGESGIGSCSTAGPGGWTGCGFGAVRRAEQQGRRIGIFNVTAPVPRRQP